MEFDILRSTCKPNFKAKDTCKLDTFFDWGLVNCPFLACIAVIFTNSTFFVGGIEQPGVASVIGLFRKDSEPNSPKTSSPTILLIEEATSLLSPRSKAAARRGSLLELSSNSVDPIQEEELLTGMTFK